MTNTITGARQILGFETESTYAEDPSSASVGSIKAFGTNETMDTQDREQGSERIYRPFDRSPNTIIEGAFEGSWSVEFVLTNANWLDLVFNTTSSPSTDVTNYSFAPNAATTSSRIVEHIEYPDGDQEQTIYVGAVVSSVDVDVSTDDTVTVSLDGSFATEYTFSTGDGDTLPYSALPDSAASGFSQPAPEGRPLHFGNAVLNAGGSPLGLVQDASVSIEGNVEIENELGTRFGVAPSFLNLETDVSFTSIVNTDAKDDRKQDMYGNSSSSSPDETIVNAQKGLTMVIGNGLSSTPKFTFNLNDTLPDSFSRSNVGSPEDPIEEDIDRLVSEVTVRVDTS